MTTTSKVRPNSSVRIGHVCLDPLEPGRLAARRLEHGGIHVDTDDRMPAPVELDGDAARATARIEDGPGTIGVDEVCLAVHVDAGRGELFEAVVVGRATRDVALPPAVGHWRARPTGSTRLRGASAVVAPAGSVNRLAGGLDEYLVNSK